MCLVGPSKVPAKNLAGAKAPLGAGSEKSAIAKAPLEGGGRAESPAGVAEKSTGPKALQGKGCRGRRPRQIMILGQSVFNKDNSSSREVTKWDGIV